MIYLITGDVGAAHATFVDLSAECTSTALRNAAHCGFKGSATAVTASAHDVLRTPQQYGLRGTYDLISLTPPYEQISYPDLLEAVCSTPLLGENTVVVLEYPTEMGNRPYILGGDKLFGVRNRRYGRTVLAIYVHRTTGGIDLRPQEFAPV
jgi:16S rRNA G966 N2-methylase RsmD